MTIFMRIASIVLLFSLISCANHTLGRNNSALALCSASCEARANSCSELCNNNCPRCSAENMHRAAKGYMYYQHEQYVKGGTLARELKSYRDPLQCRKTTCNCPADYQVCIQACGGTIQKQLKVAPVC